MNIRKLNIFSNPNDFSSMSEAMKDLPWHAMNHSNWNEDFPYRPSVLFQITHDNEFLYLHFNVTEEELRVEVKEHNGKVWEDSCVECFLSFDQGVNYYNIEFNAMGYGLIGYGPSSKRNERQKMGIEKIENIERFYQINNKEEEVQWQLILKIPVSYFQLSHFSGLKASANFYKCGDALKKPHYLSWNKILAPAPNFHLVEFFEKIYFE